jgi:hypothetical protein
LDAARARPHDEALPPAHREIAMPKDEPKVPPPPPSPEEIAKRAYELYLQRGSIPGYEVEDWLSAEAELAAAAPAPKPRKR